MKKRYKALLAAMLTGALAAGCLAGCGKMDGTAGGKMKKVTLNEVAHSIFYAPQYAAIELGYFEEEGIDLTLVNGAGADKVMTALISGDAQIGFMGSEASIYVSQEGADDPAVNFAQLTQRAGNFLVGRTAQPDFKWEDLKGKKVGVSINQTSHYLLMQALETAGLTDADVDLVNMTSSDAGVSFISGDLDAAVTWEPYLSNAVEQGVGKLIFSSKDAPVSILIKELLRSQWNRHNYWQKNNSRIRLLLTDIVV